MQGLQANAPVNSREIHGLSLPELLAVVKRNLASQNLVVISEVDMKELLRDQLNKDISEYRVLSVCLPLEAYEVIVASSETGALLTCDIVLYEPVAGRFILSWEKPQPVNQHAYPKLAIYREDLAALVEQALVFIE